MLTFTNTVVEVKRRLVRNHLNICRCLGLDAHLDGLASLASCLKLGHCGVLELDIDLVRATRGDFHIVVRIGQSLTGAGQFNGDVFCLRSVQLAVQVVLYAVGNKLVLVGSRCRDGSSNGVVVGVTTVGISVLHFLGHASFGVLRVHNHIIDGGLAIPGRCRNRNQEVRARDVLVVRNLQLAYAVHASRQVVELDLAVCVSRALGGVATSNLGCLGSIIHVSALGRGDLGNFELEACRCICAWNAGLQLGAVIALNFFGSANALVNGQAVGGCLLLRVGGAVGRVLLRDCGRQNSAHSYDGGCDRGNQAPLESIHLNLTQVGGHAR